MAMRGFRVFISCLLMAGCSGGGNGSGDQGNKDTGTDSDGPRELLYDYPEIAPKVFSLEVDGPYLYFGIMSGLYRVLKDGTGTPEFFSSSAPGANFIFDEEYAYLAGGVEVLKTDKQTKESISLPLDVENDLFAITADEERLYLTGHGCIAVASLTKNGDDLRVSSQEPSNNLCGMMAITVDDTHVYCSGGGCGRTQGKLFKVPKMGGEFTEVTTVPHALDEILTAYGPQVSGIVTLNNELYFIANFNSNVMAQTLSVVLNDGGVPESLLEMKYTMHSERLMHDIGRNSFYLFAPGNDSDKGFYKWDLTEQTSTRVLEDDGYPPAAMDEEYLYWTHLTRIYRMKKF